MADLKSVLPRQMFEKLEKGGLKTADQISLMSDYELLRLGDLSFSEIQCIKEKVSQLLLKDKISNAYAISLKEELNPRVSWGCLTVDARFMGGLKRRTLVELHGESGCGKTQLALQAAANQWQNGAVYICTEDVFPSKRLQQIFSHMPGVQPHMDKLGDKIFVIQLCEIEELKRCIRTQLPRLLSSFPSISLVVLDSVAAPFRGEFQGLGSMAERAKHLKEIGFNLLRIAKEHNLAALCINQVSSIVGSNSDVMIPCLGLAWSNMLTSRFKVEKTHQICHLDSVEKKPIGQPSSSVDCRSSNDAQVEHEVSMLPVRKMSLVFSPDSVENLNILYAITKGGVVGI